MTSAVINVRGTSQNEFKLGKIGPTLHQGTSEPLDSFGSNGDLFINRESSNENLYQKINGTWKKFSQDSLNTVGVTSSTYTVQTTDEYIGVDFNGTVTITLPSSPDTGKRFFVKDESGSASVNTITIETAGSETIDGVSSYALDNDFESITVVYRNGNYYII